MKVAVATTAAAAALAAAAQSAWAQGDLFEGSKPIVVGTAEKGGSLTLSRPEKYGTTLQAWMSAAVQVDAGAARGGPVQTSTSADGRVIGTASYQGRGTAQLSGYVGMEIAPGHAALCRSDVNAPSQDDLLKMHGAAGKACRALLEETAAQIGKQLAEGKGRSGKARAETARAEPPEPPEPRTAPGQGLKPADIHAVYHWQTTPTWDPFAFGGITFDTGMYLMLKDGSLYRGFEIPPEDFDVAASKANDAKSWGRWSGKPGAYRQTYADGDEGPMAGQRIMSICEPAKPGERFTQTFRRTSGSQLGLGGPGMATVFSEGFLRFRADGTLASESGTLASAGGSGAYAGRTEPPARYELNGYTLTLIAPDGTRERRSYCRSEKGYIVVNGAGWYDPSDE